MIKDNWIKAFDEEYGGKGIMGMSGPFHKDDVKSFIQSQIDLAIEKTNKRWITRIKKAETIGISPGANNIGIDWIKRNDLLEDKERA